MGARYTSALIYTLANMKLSTYEIQVIELMLKCKLSIDEWTKFLEGYELVDFEYTGAGYFLKIRACNLNLKEETIHEPIVLGENENFSVGFLLFVDQNEIVMECHSWGEINPPANVRELGIEIKINNDLPMV